MTNHIRNFTCPILEGGWEEITGHGLTLTEGRLYVYRGGSWEVIDSGLGANFVGTIPAGAADLGSGLKLYTLPYARVLGRGLSQWRFCHNTLLFYWFSGSFTRDVIDPMVEAVVTKQAEAWNVGDTIYLAFDTGLSEYVYRKFLSGTEWAVCVGVSAQDSSVEEEVRVLLYRRVKLPVELYGKALPSMVTILEFPLIGDAAFYGYTDYLEKIEVPATPSWDGLDYYYARYPWLWVSSSLLGTSEGIPSPIQPFSVTDPGAPDVGLGDMVVTYIPALSFAIPWPSYTQVQESSNPGVGSLTLQKTMRTGIDSAIGPTRLFNRRTVAQEHSLIIHGEENEIYQQNLPHGTLAYGLPVFAARTTEERTFTVIYSASTPSSDDDCPAVRTYWVDMLALGWLFRSPAVEVDLPAGTLTNHEVIIPEADYDELRPGQQGSITAYPKRLRYNTFFNNWPMECPDFERVGPPFPSGGCDFWFGDACECVHSVNGTCPHTNIITALEGIPESGIIDASFPTEDGSPACWWSYQYAMWGKDSGTLCSPVEPDWSCFESYECYESESDTLWGVDFFLDEQDCLAAAGNDCDSYWWVCSDPDCTCECFCEPDGWGDWELHLIWECSEWVVYLDERPNYIEAQIASFNPVGGSWDIAKQVLTSGRLPCPYDSVALADKPESVAIPGKWLKEEDMATPIPTDPDTGEPYVYASYKDLWMGDWAGLKISLNKEEGYVLIETTAALDDLEPMAGFHTRYAKAVAVDAHGRFYSALSSRGSWHQHCRSFVLTGSNKVFFRQEHNESILLRIVVGAFGPRGSNLGPGLDTNRYYRLRQRLFMIDLAEDSYTIIDI